jgi:catechol 2,3-dioxygenase-like lactoylglutathione lyase family enzyme
MITHLHSTTIVVSDQNAALDFYTKTLEWDKTMDSVMGPGMRWLTVAPKGAQTQIVLAHPDWFEGRGPNVRLGAETGITLVAKDIDDTYATLVSRGVKFKKPVEMMPWGQKGAWFSDPDGNEFFLVGE